MTNDEEITKVILVLKQTVQSLMAAVQDLQGRVTELERRAG